MDNADIIGAVGGLTMAALGAFSAFREKLIAGAAAIAGGVGLFFLALAGKLGS